VSTQQNQTFDHSDSSFDSMLEEEGILNEVNAAAIKRVTDWQIENLTKTDRSGKMSDEV
jgi:hypothetical protein